MRVLRQAGAGPSLEAAAFRPVVLVAGDKTRWIPAPSGLESGGRFVPEARLLACLRGAWGHNSFPETESPPQPQELTARRARSLVKIVCRLSELWHIRGLHLSVRVCVLLHAPSAWRFVPAHARIFATEVQLITCCKQRSL